MNYEALRSEALLHAGKARTMAAKLFNDPQASQVDAGDLLLYMARLVDRLCLAATSAAPQGWKLVPVEPTDAMLDATYDGQHASDIYRDMLAAAPEAGKGKESSNG